MILSGRTKIYPKKCWFLRLSIELLSWHKKFFFTHTPCTTPSAITITKTTNTTIITLPIKNNNKSTSSSTNKKLTQEEEKKINIYTQSPIVIVVFVISARQVNYFNVKAQLKLNLEKNSNKKWYIWSSLSPATTTQTTIPLPSPSQ